MLNTFIIVAFICWGLGLIINGFTLYSFLLIVPTLLFSARKFGIHQKLSTIITCEVMFLFFSIMWKLLFHNFTWIPILLTLLVRAVFLGICIYDDTVYVYVTEERKKI